MSISADALIGYRNGTLKELPLHVALLEESKKFSLLAYISNLAVSFMDRGDLDMARLLFRNALSLRANHVDAAAAISLARAAEASLSRIAAQDQSQELLLQDSRTAILPFMHSQGMNILSIAGAYSCDLSVRWAIASCVILFNLALSHHLSVVVKPECQTSDLGIARQLYQECRLLLLEALRRPEATGIPMVDFLSLALTNNIAHTCHCLGRFLESEFYFEQLIWFAKTMKTMGDHEGEVRIYELVNRHKTNFLLNAIVLRPPSVAGSA